MKASKYASKELDVDLCCVGENSPSYKETVNFFWESTLEQWSLDLTVLVTPRLRIRNPAKVTSGSTFVLIREHIGHQQLA